jgi:hypothetical protein
MPKPEGWTDRQLKMRDRLAKKIADNPDVEEPYAVATNIVKRRRSKARKKD